MGIHWWKVDSLNEVSVMQGFYISFVAILTLQLKKKIQLPVKWDTMTSL